MNAYDQIRRDYRQIAIDKLLDGDATTCTSPPLRTRSGDTLYYRAVRGPRGGVRVDVERVAGWVLDHQADEGKASY